MTTTPALNGADLAWMMTATALVLLMTPALGFFYGGMTGNKNVLNTILMSFTTLGFSLVAWALVGYSLAFSPGSAVLGDLRWALLNSVNLAPGQSLSPTIAPVIYMAFQATFAIITTALVSGGIIGRMRFQAYLVFITLWIVCVYAPIAHWVWGGGWLGALGALDFAGGTVVHVNAGVAALVAALVVGNRRDYGRQAFVPGNVPFVLLGASLLWFGWFGFNGGSAVASNGLAALAFVNTFLAPAGTMVVWALLDMRRTGKVTAIGIASAIVVGLVVITPASGFVPPIWALVMGGLGAVPSYYAMQWRARTPVDESLDVFAGHAVGGATGAILTGVFAVKAWNTVQNGLIAGNPQQLLIQALAVAGAAAYSALGTFVLLKLIGTVMPLRATRQDQAQGMDPTQHGEEAYTGGEGTVLVLPEISPQPKLESARAKA
ncbi:MAG TPA: ammonium transporter [bacterium]|nr:ammonium transporter [bacterium]